jgi:hypothetical protein
MCSSLGLAKNTAGQSLLLVAVSLQAVLSVSKGYMYPILHAHLRVLVNDYGGDDNEDTTRLLLLLLLLLMMMMMTMVMVMIADDVPFLPEAQVQHPG